MLSASLHATANFAAGHARVNQDPRARTLHHAAVTPAPAGQDGKGDHVIGEHSCGGMWKGSNKNVNTTFWGKLNSKIKLRFRIGSLVFGCQ
jgi:hypothetical protein